MLLRMFVFPYIKSSIVFFLGYALYLMACYKYYRYVRNTLLVSLTFWFSWPGFISKFPTLLSTCHYLLPVDYFINTNIIIVFGIIVCISCLDLVNLLDAILYVMRIQNMPNHCLFLRLFPYNSNKSQRVVIKVIKFPCKFACLRHPSP